jgi:metal-sulfur cluster biosynthetic enzyme
MNPNSEAADPTPTVNEGDILEALREVQDPELGMNLVDLGLIYHVGIQGTQVEVKMTLTTPGCPMHDQLARGARVAVLRLDGVESVDVEVVWDPPWHPGMMTDEARGQLGISAASR